MRVRFLSTIFHHAILVAASAPIVACGGQVAGGETKDADPSDTGTTTDSGIGVDTILADTPTPYCDTVGKPKESDPLPPCGYQLSVVGDPNLCGFDPKTLQGTPDLCHKLCGHSTINYCYLQIGSGGLPTYVECGGFCEGRRPESLAPCAPRGETIGRWLAQVAYLEAASIDAFRTMRQELRAHGAPKRLLRATSRAKRDEIRHARSTRALAKRYGGSTSTPNAEPRRTRSLEEIATENAIEGCVRETFGALMATVRATDARDPIVRAEMKRIARDETRHAALAWEVARWIDPRLDAGAHARVEEAKRRAVDALRAEIDSVDVEIARIVGAPSRDRSLAMLDAVAARLWS